ncbi:hypothetical protein BKA57DRAFT_505092 [Linnemannia elongata]|nr:hypothetical protein BKA57DRAFT_505092 [Linnemannia elongata]
MARRQSCSDLPPTSIIIPPYSRTSSPPFVSKVSSHSRSASTDMRPSVKSRLLRNWIGQSGQQEYKVLERSLARFHQKDRYRIDVLKTSLLPWLRKDQPSLDSLSETSLRTGRQLIMQWWTTLLAVLPDALYTDRCHYFECIIALMTRKEFDEFDRLEDVVSKPTTPSTVRTFLDGSVTEHNSSSTSVSSSTTLGSGYPFSDSGAFWSSFHQYRKMLTQSLQYAIERLNQKGVYSNVITFCAKILALCFFKLPGVAFGLLHALPASRSYISRMAKAMDLIGENCGMPQIMTFFPEHLAPICFTGTGSWWREFENQKRRTATGDSVPPMEMFGNWVRRWQSDDSELFFAFYRHYHHCLSQYLEAPLQRIQAGGWATSAITPKVYAGAPGYLYLSAFFLTKIEGLVHREIHPVTTIVQFEPNAANGNGAAERDRAMASVATGEFPGTAAPPAVKANGDGKDSNGGPTNGKPKVLDMASRRFVETIVAIMEDHGNIYGAMLDIWIKAVVTKTSVYDVESVFCLLDFLDMLIAELESRECIRLYDSELSTVPLNTGPNIVFVPIHVQFILSTLHLLLTASDHTVTLMRTISFIYQNFSLLTGTVQTLEQLTLGTLLSPDVFEKCFLHWARNVRLYYMRCLVWRVARIGGGVGVLPGFRAWTPSARSSMQEGSVPTGGMMAASSNGGATSDSSIKKKVKDSPPTSRGSVAESPLSLIVRNIFEVMESRIDMVKRQYSGELSEVMSTRISDKESESLTCDSAPSSPGLENVPSISTAGDSPAGSSPSRQRSLSDGTMMHNGGDDDSQERARSFYQLQAQQIYLTHQKLTASDDGIKDKDKDRAKKSSSRSSLLSRKFRRLSRPDSSAGSDGQQQRHSFQEGDAGLYDPTLGNLMGGGQNSPNGSTKRASTGSNSLTAGSLFRWMFMGGQSSGSSNKLSALVSGGGGGSSSGDRSPYSNQSLASQSSTSSLSSLTLMNSYNEQAGDVYRHRGNGYGTSYPRPLTDSFLRYGMKSRKYPDHLTTYAGRALPEHTAVLNEYVDWLAQCNAYGIKSKMGYAQQGSSNGGGTAGQGAGQPGGVPGLGLGTSPAATGSMGEGCGVVSGDFSIFSLSLGKVVDASTVSGHHHDEWISAGMAQMMILRFPGLVVEWPKFWNNSREASGPPPGPITTLTAMAVVNNPMLSLGKGNAGGVGGGVSAGAGGSFGGASLNGSSGNGPSSLKHQQQAQMHHQQQMQLWSRNAAAAAAAAAAASATSGAAAT